MKNELNTLADMLAAYRNNERHFPTYDDLAGLLNAQPRVSCDPAENEHLARDAQAIVDAEVAALAAGQVYLSAVDAAAAAVRSAAAPQVVADERAAFEAKHAGRFDMRRCSNNPERYFVHSTNWVWDSWQARAALAAAPVQAQAPVHMKWGHDGSLTPVQPVAVPDGWCQFIDGVKTQNVARDTKELDDIKSIFKVMAPSGAQAEYRPFYFAAPAAQGDAIKKAERYDYIRSEESRDHAHHKRRALVAGIQDWGVSIDPSTTFNGWSVDYLTGDALDAAIDAAIAAKAAS